jgi:hypothetical protein
MEEVEMIEAYIPDDPAIERFHSLSNANKTKVIKLGLAFLDEGRVRSQGWDNAEWQARLDKAQEKHAAERLLMESRVEEVQRAYDTYRSEQKQARLDLADDIASRERARLQGDLTRLETANSALEEKTLSLMSQLQTIHSTLEERYTSRYQAALSKQEERYDALHQSYENLLTRTTNSTQKGKDGEDFVFGQINMLFPKAEIEDTHATPHRGDFIVKDEHITLMVETKNYTRNVQKGEIDKFYRDIDNSANNDVTCAVFVSLHSGISGKDDFSFEIRNMKPILFIHNLAHDFRALQLAVKYFHMVMNQDGVDFSAKEVCDTFRNAATMIKKLYQKQRTRLDRYYSEQMSLFTEHEGLVSQLFSTACQKY